MTPGGPLAPPVPARDGFGARLREVLQSWARALRSWEIWVHLGVQDIKNRYKRSLVGPLWIAISLAVMVAGMSFLFGRLFSQEGGRYLIYLTIGMMLWSLLSSSFTDGGYAFLGAESYIRQIPQAKQVYVLRCTVVNLVVFSFGLPVFVVAALLYGQLRASLPWALLGFALVVVACVGHSAIMAYLSVPFRDLPPASASALQIVYFLTPILYPVDLMRQRGLEWFLHVNPLFYLLEIVRHPILEGGAAPPEIYAGAVVYTAVVWAVGLGVAASLDRRIPALL
jgi:ABC-type polysaccharide/polyol phosphate export permease